MSANVLLNLLNELRKIDKMRGLLKSRIFGVKTSIFCHLLRNVILDAIM